MAVSFPHDYDPAWVPVGDAAGEEPRSAPVSRAELAAPELPPPAPEAGGALDSGGIHWKEHSELGLGDAHAHEDTEEH